MAVFFNGSAQIAAGLCFQLKLSEIGAVLQSIHDFVYKVDGVDRTVTDILCQPLTGFPTGCGAGTYFWLAGDSGGPDGRYVAGSVPFGIGLHTVHFKGEDPNDNDGIIDETIEVVPVPVGAVEFNGGVDTVGGFGPWPVAFDVPGAATVEILDTRFAGNGFLPVAETAVGNLTEVSFSGGTIDGTYSLCARFRACPGAVCFFDVCVDVALDTTAPVFILTAEVC